MAAIRPNARFGDAPPVSIGKMKIASVLASTLVIAIAAVMAFVLIFAVMWGRQFEMSKVRANGEFAKRFSDLYGEGPGSMSNYQSARLESWFRSSLPVGTDRAMCRNILSKSFTVDMTTGAFIVIDRMSIFPAGGQDTKVRLIFDGNNRFQDVEVRQNNVWVSTGPLSMPNNPWIATITSPSVYAALTSFNHNPAFDTGSR